MEGRLIPARVSSPGKILARELEARDWTQSELAELIDRPEQTVSGIVNARKQVTPETALELAEALGTTPEFWLNLEMNYRLHLARQQQSSGESISRRLKLHQMAPVRELIKRGWIEDSKSLDVLAHNVCAFMGVTSIDEVPIAAASFRNSTTYTPEDSSKIAWLRRVQHLVQNEPSEGESQLAALADNLAELLALSTEPDGALQVESFLRTYEVDFKVVPHLPKTYTDGAAFRHNGRPVIALTLRYNRNDNFWFTLMHELAHLVLDHDDVLFETVQLGHAENPGEKNEQEANAWARDSLIPPAEYAAFLEDSKLTGTSIRRFAASINRHPGIILGRLQWDGHLNYNRFRNLFTKLDRARMQSQPTHALSPPSSQ